MAATVLITGASSGIGKALAEVFAEAGHSLILVARREAKLEEIAAMLRECYEVEVRVEVADLGRVEHVKALHHRLKIAGETVEILVNNAGRGDVGNFLDIDDLEDLQTLQLNVVALTYLCKLFGRDMAQRGHGRILNIASLGGFVPGPLMAVYIASKHYVLSLSEALHDELKQRGVSVTASCPGPTQSEFHRKSGTEKLNAMRWIKLMDAKVVAEEAYQATMAGEAVVVHGLLNRLLAQSPRLLPRAFANRLTGVLMRLSV